jgi:hypothetical protein
VGVTLFFTTGFFFWISYLVDGLRDINHQCGNCGVLMARWHRSGRIDVFQ